MADSCVSTSELAAALPAVEPVERLLERMIHEGTACAGDGSHEALTRAAEVHAAQSTRLRGLATLFTLAADRADLQARREAARAAGAEPPRW